MKVWIMSALLLNASAGALHSSVLAESRQGGQEALSGQAKAGKVVEQAIEAMGGDAYRNVQNSTSSGRYFVFSKGRKGFTQFQDWTVYQDPVKSRFQLGKGKRQQVDILNLELRKGWTLEGEDDVKEKTSEEIDDFSSSLRRDLDYVLRNLLKADEINYYYYSTDEISGGGNTEAVEFVDAANHSLVVFFDLDTHLPVKTESHFTDKLGLRHKREEEFYNWHWIQGVYSPLRRDIYVDGEVAQQLFLEELSYNVSIPPETFTEPVVKEKK